MLSKINNYFNVVFKEYKMELNVIIFVYKY